MVGQRMALRGHMEAKILEIHGWHNRITRGLPQPFSQVERDSAWWRLPNMVAMQNSCRVNMVVEASHKLGRIGLAEEK